MVNRSTSNSTRLRRNVNPVAFIGKLGSALGIKCPSSPADVVKIPFPDVNSSTFREEYLCKEVLRKYPGFDLGIDTHQVALSGLFDQEATNRKTNDRLSTGTSGNPDVNRAFCLASQKVVQVLGRFSWDLFNDGLRFGPGATTRLNRCEANLVGKLTGAPHVTPRASHLAYTVLTTRPAWVYRVNKCVSEELVLKMMNYDKVTCVPKSATTDRTIGIQPDLNVMLQLGVAYVMRKRFQKWGLNLNDQSINQRLAKRASRDASLATIDLQGASNSMTTELVWRMVGDHSHNHSPVDPTWYKVLDALRTESGLVEGKLHTYELFSSMGNGFTFELESLIFWSITKACCEILGATGVVSVYGDDIICPREVVNLLRDVLAYAGFTFNESKSFFLAKDHVFRESCGKHYLDGKDVTPFYVTEPLTTIPEVVLLANNILRWAHNGSWGLDGRLEALYDWVIGHLPERAQKCAIPFGEDDDGLIKNFDAVCPTVKYSGAVRYRTDIKFRQVLCHWKPQRLGYSVRTVRWHTRGRSVQGSDGLLVWLYSKSFRIFRPAIEGTINLSVNEVAEYKVPSLKKEIKYSKRMVTSWNDPGPWIHTDEPNGSQTPISREERVSLYEGDDTAVKQDKKHFVKDGTTQRVVPMRGFLPIMTDY